jgi:hypothetical protein
MKLDQAAASQFASIALGHVRKPYPYKMDHVLNSDEDARPPRHFHPIFYGSFDWHSCVHGWWTLLTLRRLFPDMAEADAIAQLADDSFTAVKVAGERAYLDRPNSRGFERPYGWGWLMALQLEASRHADRSWGEALEPLARAFADRLRAYLAILTYPIRVGTHFNTSFGLLLALDWAEAFDQELADTIRAFAGDRYGDDRDCQAWEPGGDEFLSSALTEAHLMARVLDEAAFRTWFAAFLPRLQQRQPASLFTPAKVSDRSDGKIAHLDGLNLSRAWCWRRIGTQLGAKDAAVARASADEHLAAGLPHLASDYAGEHWLATFALLALLAE